MKKTVAFLLAVTMLLTLCACGEKKGDNGNTTPSGSSVNSDLDLQQLEIWIAWVADLSSEEFDAASWAVLEDSLRAARQARRANTQEAVDTALKNLQDAVEALLSADGTPATLTPPTVATTVKTTQKTTTTRVEGTSTTSTRSTSTTTRDKDTDAPTTTHLSSTTKRPTTTTSTTKATTTKPTTKPTEPDKPVDNRPTIKILSIGHSFSRDAMDTYMADLFKAAGWNATFGYLYYPGASLERQYHYVKDDSTSYELYNKCVDGKWYYSQGNQKASTALSDEDWDIVTFQPSPDFGKGTMASPCDWGCQSDPKNDYAHFDQLVRLVKDKLKTFGNEDAKFYYHLTWSFASDCKLWSFIYSNYNQTTMYWDFLRATSQYVLPNPYIEDKFIPCNTAIQNVRTSWMGDTFNEPGNYNPNSDGYHLNDKGDLVAAMTWVAFFTGKSAKDFKISTQYTDAQYAAFAEAVDNAIKKPLDITNSTYTTAP